MIVEAYLSVSSSKYCLLHNVRDHVLYDCGGLYVCSPKHCLLYKVCVIMCCMIVEAYLSVSLSSPACCMNCV